MIYQIITIFDNLWNTVSNSQNEVPDRYSDAVRDLRTSYNISSDEGVLCFNLWLYSFINDKLSNQAAIILQARALGRAISDVLQITGKEKVILVGHSMGGLAAREYLQNSSHGQGNTHHRVAKLMTSGTPHST